jgi:hypothetical protein
MTFRNIIEEFPPAHHFDGVNITLSNNPNEPEIIDDFSQTVVDGSNLILTYISFTEVLHHAVEEFESECMSGSGGGGGIHKFEQTLSFYERTFHPEVTSSTGGGDEISRKDAYIDCVYNFQQKLMGLHPFSSRKSTLDEAMEAFVRLFHAYDQYMS